MWCANLALRRASEKKKKKLLFLTNNICRLTPIFLPHRSGGGGGEFRLHHLLLAAPSALGASLTNESILSSMRSGQSHCRIGRPNDPYQCELSYLTEIDFGKSPEF